MLHRHNSTVHVLIVTVGTKMLWGKQGFPVEVQQLTLTPRYTWAFRNCTILSFCASPPLPLTESSSRHSVKLCRGLYRFVLNVCKEICRMGRPVCPCSTVNVRLSKRNVYVCGLILLWERKKVTVCETRKKRDVSSAENEGVKAFRLKCNPEETFIGI